jgi:pimeloyl-ACP methyl ester carboxylesterase
VRTLRVQGRPAQVWRGGSGQALLLIHGGLGDARLHWEPVWESLAASFTVAAPDLPGFGGTAPLPAAGFSAVMGWTAALMETLGFPRAVLVGNSFGGLVARHYAAAHPARAVRLVLVNGGTAPRIPALLQQWISRPGLGEALVEWMRRWAFSRGGLKWLIADERLLTPDFVARTQAASTEFVRLMRGAFATPLSPNQTPRCPTLVLWGERDRLAPLSRGRALAAQIPGAVLRPVPGAGHMPQLEQPADFTAAVREFCRQR